MSGSHSAEKREEQGGESAVTGNLFSNVQHTEGPEEFFTLLKDGNVEVQKIVSHGTSSEWFDQDTAEFVALLQGEARLLFEGKSEELVMGPGDFVGIPKHKRHRVTYTAPDRPTVWLAFHWK